MRQVWRVLSFDLASLLLLGFSLYAADENPSSPDPLAARTAQLDTPLVFAGLPAVVEFPRGTLQSLFAEVDAGKQCNTFTLVPYAGTLQAVRVTSSGLGSVDFSVSSKNVRNQITIDRLNPEGVSVDFCVHGDLIRQPASYLQGKVIAFAAGYRPAIADVKLDRPNLAPWVSALQWFVAILVPALLAGAFGAGSAWVTSGLVQRREQKTAFRKFKDDKWDDLTDFFHTYLRNVRQACENEQEFSKRLRSELQSRGYWTSIPWKERDQIERFIKQQELSRMRSVLTVLFLEWEMDLSELRK